MEKTIEITKPKIKNNYELIEGVDYDYYVLENGTIEIAKYKGSENELTIPNEIDNKCVTSIGDSAFFYCNSLTSITIPDSVTSIGSEAFADCESLTLTVGRDSYAMQYAKENGLNYQYSDALD